MHDRVPPAQTPPPPAGFWSRLGPGLVTGAADDDPSGIATYSQVGAAYGYTMAWTMLFSWPLMAVIQGVAAGIGSVTGRGIAANLRRHYPRPLLFGVVGLLVIANVINLGADLGAMGAAVAMLGGGPHWIYTILFGIACVALEVLVPYARYANLLKWTTLSLFSYVAVVLVVGISPQDALRGLLIPTLTLDAGHAMALVAVLGTTISPYLFFWQAAQEVEEGKRRHVRPLHITPLTADGEISRIRIDTIVGMGFSNFVAIAIILATAATLHAHGVTRIETSAQAAQALLPIAGRFTYLLFALGIIGTGMLAVPVLAGSVAYAVSEIFGWKESLAAKPGKARGFYATIALATLIGGGLTFIGLDPVRALYWAAVVNGLLAAPLMAVMMLIARNRRIMGELTLNPALTIGGWLATAVMAVASAAFLWFSLSGG
jgi:NRAMP (natural resistance-associated macrophage protein)-like metal ion transporter